MTFDMLIYGSRSCTFIIEVSLIVRGVKTPTVAKDDPHLRSTLQLLDFANFTNVDTAPKSAWF